MEHRSLIFLIVIAVFAYVIIKFKLLPYLAAKKILKDAKTPKDGGTSSHEAVGGSASADTLTSLATLAALTHGANPYAAPAQMPPAQPQGRDKRDMYFDHCVIDTLDIERGMAGIDVLLTGLRTRGICPDTFNLLPLPDGSLLAYVTYTL